MIEQWRILKKTSVDGFRESFLQREGRLSLQENGWSLKVARASYDVLLDQLPWGISVVLLPWMKSADFRRMVTKELLTPLSANAVTLERELDWLANVLQTRINLYLDRDSRWPSIHVIEPPELSQMNPSTPPSCSTTRWSSRSGWCCCLH